MMKSMTFERMQDIRESPLLKTPLALFPTKSHLGILNHTNHKRSILPHQGPRVPIFPTHTEPSHNTVDRLLKLLRVKYRIFLLLLLQSPTEVLTNVLTRKLVLVGLDIILTVMKLKKKLEI